MGLLGGFLNILFRLLVYATGLGLDFFYLQQKARIYRNETGLGVKLCDALKFTEDYIEGALYTREMHLLGHNR